MSNISHIISVLENFQGNEDEINAWKESDDFIDTALQIISTSNNNNVIFLAATVLRLKLVDIIDKMDESQLETLFQFFLEQISSGRQFDSTAFLQLLKCTAFIACANLDFMDQVSFLPQDVLLNFFEFCFEINKSPIFFNNTNVQEKLNELIPYFIDILQNSELSTEWFRFHTSVMSYRPFSDVAVLFPRIQEAAQNPEYFTGIYTIYEYVISVPFENEREIPEDVEYIDNLISLMLQISEVVLQTEDINNYQFVSLIYSSLIDYGPEYFLYHKDIPEIMGFFDKFLSILPNFTGEAVEAELFTLISYSRSFITYSRLVEPENPVINNFMINLIKFMIDLVNTGETRFLQHALRKAFYKITDIGNSYDNPAYRFLQPIISRFFIESLKNPTPGVFYAIAYSSVPTRIMHSTLASQILIAMEEKPFTVVYFTRTCSQYANESIVPLMQICYSFADTMPREVAKTISVVANVFYDKFIENSAEFIEPVLEWIQSTEPDVTAQLLSAMFSIITHVAPTTPNINDILDTLTSAVEGAITSVVETEEVTPFLKFLITIVKGTPQELDPAFYTYFYQLYDSIESLFENIWTNVAVFSPFTRLLKHCVERHWLNPETHMETIVEWLQNCFPDNVIPEHFSLICASLQYLDSGFVENFFTSFMDDEDKEIIVKLFKTCVKLVEKDITYFPIAINIIFHNLEKLSYSSKKAAQALEQIIQIKGIDLNEVAEQIPPLIIPVMLKISEHNEIFCPLSILFHLKDVIDPSSLTSAIVEAAGSIPEAVRFGETFLTTKIIDDCFADAVAMVIAYKSSLSPPSE